MKYDDLHLGAGLDGGLGLPVGPHSEDRVILAWVELRYDECLHR